MSEINNALSKLAEQESVNKVTGDNADGQKVHIETTSHLVRAKIEPVKSNGSRFVWALGGFILSLGVGAWAVTGETPSTHDYSASTAGSVDSEPMAVPVIKENKNGLITKQSNTNQATSESHARSASNIQDTQSNRQSVQSNTSKSIEKSTSGIYHSSVTGGAKSADAKLAMSHNDTPQSKVTSIVPETKSARYASQQSGKQNTASGSTRANSYKKEQPIRLANNQSSTAQQTRSRSTTSNKSSLSVNQVQLTHQQLSEKAIDRANKALDSNDLKSATEEFETALRYVPENENIRRKLAALYYGNRNVRKSGELLEQGIIRNKNSSELRMALATILLKENQEEAALNTLGYLPENVTKKYLALRGALAQQLKKSDWALQSYQMLIKQEPENGRWWLGVAIQQERNKQLSEAKTSYTNALGMVGLSSSSQDFIRNRLSIINSALSSNKGDS